MNLAGHEYEERAMVRRVLLNMRGTTRYGQYRWSEVAYLFGMGSTVARALCREFDLDPYEVLKR